MKLGLALYNALTAANVPADKAEAVVDALEAEMQNQLATKHDLAQLELRLYRALLIQTLTLAGLMVAIIKLL
ncbi:hypothetical protein [Billgrantia desiderata]|uniref:hypothetical protein n=1 Tax=Billgrantia desiderata TaxID=52021 RepID=UPI001F33F168|nr:hypothetical protein [Halomonas desiderata]MCE8014427.1 hypothetical protein [Halomonas desiderata]